MIEHKLAKSLIILEYNLSNIANNLLCEVRRERKFSGNVDVHEINDPQISMKLALVCLNNLATSDDYGSYIQDLSDLISNWLDGQYVSFMEVANFSNNIHLYLNNIARQLNRARPGRFDELNKLYNAIMIVGDCVRALYHFVNGMNGAGYNSIALAIEHAEAYRQTYFIGAPIIDYNSILRSMTTDRDVSDDSRNLVTMTGFQRCDTAAIMATFDRLIELDQVGPDHFLDHDGETGEWLFNFGHGHVLRADDAEDLANLIVSDRVYSREFERLFGHRVVTPVRDLHSDDFA